VLGDAVSALAVYLFQCDATEMFALTLYRDGHNIPAGVCAGTWRLKGQLSLTLQSLSSLPLDASAVLGELALEGYAIVRLPEDLIMLP
jgi:hypothetical protein